MKPLNGSNDNTSNANTTIASNSSSKQKPMALPMPEKKKETVVHVKRADVIMPKKMVPKAVAPEVNVVALPEGKLFFLHIS